MNTQSLALISIKMVKNWGVVVIHKTRKCKEKLFSYKIALVFKTQNLSYVT